MKPTVYIETTIPSYLTAWPSNNLLMAAHQLSTKQWWETRDQFELFVSSVVIQECEKGDPLATDLRLKALQGIPVLLANEYHEKFLNEMIAELKLPSKAEADAGHIALAAIYGMDYLLTWNCKHIANATLRLKIVKVCERAGLICPMICTPDQLITN
jgi:hypothetical protein